MMQKIASKTFSALHMSLYEPSFTSAAFPIQKRKGSLKSFIADGQLEKNLNFARILVCVSPSVILFVVY